VRRQLRMVLGLALAQAIFSPGAAAHDLICAPRPIVLERLEREYRERIRATGLLGNGELVALALDEASGSFTLLVLSPRGGACVLLAGEDWAYAPPLPKPEY
jgi:hypothetical protein